jgi:hypothetical protein
MTGITFYCHHFPDLQLEVIYIPEKFLSTSFKPHLHNIERLVPFWKIHI